MRPFLIGLALGVALLGLLRFAAAPLDPTTHHHANWAVIVNGTRVDLSDDRFMEEISACTASDEGIGPTQRIHMHENLDEVVHVHHPGATWGHLMTNLGFGLGDDWLFLDGDVVEGIDGAPDDGRFMENGGSGRLVFVVNGFVVPSLVNRVVASEDRVLVAWTDVAVETVRTEWFERVADDAGRYNDRMDPASCSGGHGELPLLARLRLAFWG